MTLQHLALAPFHLDETAIAWVRKTCDSLSLDERLRQLFVLALRDVADDGGAAVLAMRPGGVHRFAGTDAHAAWALSQRALATEGVPMIVTADLEGGAYGLPFGTAMPNPLGLAAVADLDASREVTRAIAAEGRALGIAWSFSPVIDINQAWQSAIVGTRSFGTDLVAIEAQAVAHVQAMQAAGIAATAKHWPGEGFDARDQHLVTTTNPLDIGAWEASFGRLYRALIGAGVMSVMSAHIAQPAWARHLQPGAQEREWYRPASVSAALNIGLLRGRLGFNGVIVSDATGMGGLTSWAAPEQYVPEVIANGCDVFLFSRHPERDLALLHAAVRDGRLSEARVEQALLRVLGLKAALGLHRQAPDERLPPWQQASATFAAPAHQALAEHVAQRSITLVKDVHGLLPITPQRHRRVLVVADRQRVQVPGSEAASLEPLLSGLRERGFEPRLHDAGVPMAQTTPQDADLLLYVLRQESMLTLSRLYLDWTQLHGDMMSAMARHWHAMPTLMVSFGHPYHLADAPRVPAYINAYSAIAPVQRALLRCLVGETPFVGGQPVDAFCGLADARF